MYNVCVPLISKLSVNHEIAKFNGKEERDMLFNVENAAMGCFEAGIPIAGCIVLGW